MRAPTVFVHPDVAKVLAGTMGGYTFHNTFQIAFVGVWLHGLQRYAGGVTDNNAALIQSFLDYCELKGTAYNNYHGKVSDMRKKWSDKQAKPMNGLMEYCGGSVVIIWEWEQIMEWLKTGWPTKRTMSNSSCPFGTWCFMENEDPNKDHIERDSMSGWPLAMKQMRAIGIPKEVYHLQRLMSDTEQIDGLCGAIKKHRFTLNKELKKQHQYGAE